MKDEIVILPPAPRTIRRASGHTQVEIAAFAGVSIGTVRVYELAPEAVRPAPRRRLNAVYAVLRDEPPPSRRAA